MTHVNVGEFVITMSLCFHPVMKLVPRFFFYQERKLWIIDTIKNPKVSVFVTRFIIAPSYVSIISAKGKFWGIMGDLIMGDL